MYRFYNFYRCALALVLILLSQASVTTEFFKHVSSLQGMVFSLVYLCITIVTMIRFYQPPSAPVIFAITCLDIMLLSFLINISGLQDNGTTNLLFVPIAIGNALIFGRIGVLLAAMASIFLLVLSYSGGAQQLDAGMKGILFFATSLLIQSYNFRIKTSELSAQKSRNKAIDLQKLSQSIMQHMRTGILVLEEPNRVIMMNSAARTMLSTTATDGLLQSLSLPLQISYQQWLNNPHLRPDSFRISDESPEAQPSFSRLDFEEHTYILIFLDDKATMAQQAQQLKLASLGRLTASIAHEIRNPLGAISHSAQLLAESEHLDPYDMKLLDIVHKHCNRMNDIIQTILQLSRKDEWRPEIICINSWLKHFIDEEHFDGFPAPDIQYLSSEEQLLVRFDPKQLHQVVMNLTLNGMRYSERQTGHATLALRIGHNRNGNTWLEIADNGPGIPESQQAQIFEPFFTTDKQGTGLGLYISRELCEMNQASLTLASSLPEAGSTFRIAFAHPDKKIN